MRFFKYSEQSNAEKQPDAVGNREGIKSKGFSSFLAKIVCIIAAIIVWFYVSGDQSTTYEKEFRGVQISDVDMTALESQGFTVINGNVLTTVDVTVSGTRRDVNSIRSDEITARIDLSGIYTAGEHSLKVDVTAPVKTRVKKVYPSEIKLYIGKSTKKSFDIEAVAHNVSMSDPSLKIKEYRFSVDEIEVTGPEQELDKIAGAIVDLDFSGEKLSNTVIRSNVTIKLVDENGNEVKSSFISANRKETNVEVVVNKYVTVPVKPKYSDSSFDVREAGYSETVRPQTVDIYGNPDVIDGISYIETATMDSEDIGSGNYSAEVNLIIPQGVYCEDTATKKASVILVRENGTKNVSVHNILFLNVPKDYKIECPEETIEIRLSGNLGVMDSLDEHNLYFVADLSFITDEAVYEGVKLKLRCFDLDVLDNGSVEVDGNYTCTIIANKIANSIDESEMTEEA